MAEVQRTLQESKKLLQFRTRELQERTTELRALAIQAQRAESHERKRLAAILHYGIQQLLTPAKLTLEGVLAYRRLELSTKGSLSRALGFLTEAVAQSRALAAELAPPL